MLSTWEEKDRVRKAFGLCGATPLARSRFHGHDRATARFFDARFARADCKPCRAGERAGGGGRAQELEEVRG